MVALDADQLVDIAAADATQQAIGGLISLLASVVQLMEEIGPLPVIGDAHTTVFDHSTRRPTP